MGGSTVIRVDRDYSFLIKVRVLQGEFCGLGLLMGLLIVCQELKYWLFRRNSTDILSSWISINMCVPWGNRSCSCPGKGNPSASHIWTLSLSSEKGMIKLLINISSVTWSCWFSLCLVYNLFKSTEPISNFSNLFLHFYHHYLVIAIDAMVYDLTKVGFGFF